MMTLFQIILSLLVLALLVPVAVLLLQVLAAIGKRAVVIAVSYTHLTLPTILLV